MTQDVKHLVRRSVVLEEEVSGEGSSVSNTPHSPDVLKEQLKAAQDSIQFLQREHASMLRGLHEEVERLQDLCRDLQFRCEAGGCLLPDGDFFKCSPECLKQKVNALVQENSELKRRLSESHQAIDILDQKEKLALWQHHQELEQRDSAILRLEKELETKCSTLAQLSSSTTSRRKKSNFWRRFSFASNHPSTSAPAPHPPPRVDHLSKEDLPSEILQSIESQYQSYSSYSSLSSDKDLSDDEGFGQVRCDRPPELTVRLPPIANRLPVVVSSSRRLVRQQLRVNSLANRVATSDTDTLAIDQIQTTPEVTVKRVSKA